MKKVLLIFIALFVCLYILGCGSPVTREIYKQENSQKITEDVKKSKLSDADKKIFEQAIEERADEVTNQTVEDIIAKQKEINKKAEEERKNLKIGSVMKTKYTETTLRNVSFSYDVLPKTTSSFYTHYPARKGEVYIDIDIVAKNLAKQQVRCDGIVKVTAVYGDGFKYSGFTIVEDERSGFTYANITRIDPLTTKDLHCLISLPEEAEKSNNPIVLHFEIDDTKFEYKMR